MNAQPLLTPAGRREQRTNGDGVADVPAPRSSARLSPQRLPETTADMKAVADT